MAISLRSIASFLEPVRPQPEHTNEENIEEMPTLMHDKNEEKMPIMESKE